MRKEYINKVQKELTVSRKQKREIIRDLNEAFDSAKEHKETEIQVIERLGTPKDFAENVAETLDFNQMQYRKRKKFLLAFYFSCGIAIFCLIGSLIAKHALLPDNVIGQADAMTAITIYDTSSIDFWIVLLIIGLIFAIIAVVLIICSIRRRK